MKISELGGEFALIKHLTNINIDDPRIIKGIGDDCAVIRYTDEKHLLITTDMMVEDDHFNLEWYTPQQIGSKLVEVNVSDIVAMGGIPQYAFFSMSLTRETSVEFMESFFKGFNQAADRHNLLLLGGDTTHGHKYVFNLTVIGSCPPSLLRLRSDALIGDAICVTGDLGGSTAGFNLLLNKKKGCTEDHLQPQSRTSKEGQIIARFAHAMIDVSDGLGSEINHICNESNLGACIFYDTIPLSENTVHSAEALQMDAHEFALYGGEDFELVFTIKKYNIPFLKREFNDFSVVGEILPKKMGVYIKKQEQIIPLKRGFDHFA
jgi:thiamine-monophosphate kinase